MDTKLDGDMLENFNNLIFFIHLLWFVIFGNGYNYYDMIFIFKLKLIIFKYLSIPIP